MGPNVARRIATVISKAHMNVIARNTASNAFVFFVRLVIMFIMTPIYIRALGNYDYGIWEIMMATVGYLGILDLGLRPAVSRYVAHFTAAGTAEDHGRLYTTAVLALGGIGLIASSLLVVWATLAPSVIAPEGTDASRYSLLIALFACQVAIAFPGYVFESFLEGFQRYVAKNIIGLAIGISIAVGFVSLQRQYDPLLLLASLSACGTVIRACVFSLLLRLNPRSRLSLFRTAGSVALAKELFTFGFKSSVQGASTIVSSRTDVLIVGAVIGPAQVVYYSIAAAVTSHISSLRAILTHPLMPAFTELASTSGKQAVVDLYRRGSLLTLAVLVPLCVGASLIGSAFIGLWIGPEYGEASAVLLPILLITVLLRSIMPLSSRYLTAINRHGIFAKVLPVETTIHVALSLLLVHRFGVTGVVLGAAISSLVMVIPIARSISTHLGYGFISYTKDCILPLILPTAIMAAVVTVASHYMPPSSYVNLVLLIAAGGFAYLLSLVYTVPRSDLNSIIRGLGFGRDQSALQKADG